MFNNALYLIIIATICIKPCAPDRMDGRFSNPIFYETFVQLLQVEQMNKTNSIYESLQHWNITKNEKPLKV